MTLGKRVKDARTREKLTQKELAGKLGASQHYVSDIERDIKHPSEAMLRRIAAALDTTPEALLYTAPPDARPEPLTPKELEELAEAAETILRIHARLQRKTNG